jgi:hypothetical protein
MGNEVVKTGRIEKIIDDFDENEMTNYSVEDLKVIILYISCLNFLFII